MENHISLGRKLRLQNWNGCVTLLLTLTLGCAFFQEAAAVSLFEGKASEVFSENSSQISSRGVLDDIVSFVEEDITINKIEFILFCIANLPEGEASTLGKERAMVLEKFFKNRLSDVEITGMGDSVNLLSSGERNDINEALVFSDILVIEGSSNGENTRKSTEEKIGEIKEELRVRYEEVVKQHRYLCETTYNPPSYMEENCRPYDKGSLESYLCGFRRSTFWLQYPKTGKGSIGSIEHNLERVNKLQLTLGEILDIFNDIKKINGGAEVEKESQEFLNREVRRQLLAVKHLKRALATTYQALKRLPKIGAGNSDIRDISEVGYSYRNLSTIYELFALNYSRMTLRQSINRVRGIHNFIRENVGLEKIDNNQNYPICVDTSTFLDTSTPNLEEVKELYREAQARARRNGITLMELNTSL